MVQPDITDVLKTTQKYYEKKLMEDMYKTIYGLPNTSKIKLSRWDHIKFYIQNRIQSFRTWLGEKIAGRSFDDYYD